MSKEGLFIALEGPEGAGKTTQARLLVESLHKIGRTDAVQTREPGGTRIGETIRQILLDPENKGMHPLTEFFLFLAARARFVQDIVRPKVDAGQIVVADRFALSTMAYQIYARRLPVGPCMSAIDLAIQNYQPDLYILLSVSPEIGRHRQELQGKMADRFEQEALDFHRRVTEGYTFFGGQIPNCRVISTDNRTETEVQVEVLRCLREEFPEHFSSL